MRGATLNSWCFFTVAIFQSTHPLRGATKAEAHTLTIPVISIHAPLAGCDDFEQASLADAGNFNPRTPCGVRPDRVKAATPIKQFQSTHPLRGATCKELDDIADKRISIHAPLAGCDRLCPVDTGNLRFQSTHPLRGATRLTTDTPKNNLISIHAPLAGCDSRCSSSEIPNRYFNPRTPCGVRRAAVQGGRYGVEFQSTHPLRGATDVFR